MDVHSLRGFVAVAEELSFRKAAERLHMGQPGLSRLIARLERELGVKLLDRSTTHVELTAAGALFLRRARSVLSTVDMAVREAKQNGADPTGRLHIGVSQWAEQLVPPILHALTRSSPAVRLELEQLAPELPVDDLGDGRLDVVFCRTLPRDQRVEADVLADEPLVAAVPVGHRLDADGGIGIADLVDEPLVLFPRSIAPGARDQIVGLCGRAGFRPHVAHETVPPTLVPALVAAGGGIALVPGSMRNRFDSGHVRCRPIAAPAPTMPLVLARRRSDSSLVVGRLSEVASEALRAVAAFENLGS